MRQVKASIYGDGGWKDIEGDFHGWGLSTIENRDNIVSYTIGIIELSNGTIVEALPERIRFTDR